MIETYSPPSFSSRSELRDLLTRSLPQQQALRDLYGRLPATKCRRRACCCSLLPEATLVEVLEVLHGLNRFTTTTKDGLLKKLVRYFLINPLEITSCPFFENGNCLIYPVRFFGCRAYGLWSPKIYEQRADAGREARRGLAGAWLRLGVRLPAEVTEFQVPYCRSVVPVDDEGTDDRTLVRVEDEIQTLSGQLHPEHDRFQNVYYADLSFLIAGLIYGVPEALRLKVALVQEGLKTGTPRAIDAVVCSLSVHDLEFF